MSDYEPIAIGKVDAVCVNGGEIEGIMIKREGVFSDIHSHNTRRLSGHDGRFKKTTGLIDGEEVFNWRTWTGISSEEIREVEEAAGFSIPVGIILENIRFSGIPDFSKIQPGSYLVFPSKAVLAVWSENGPCKTVGKRLEELHQKEGVNTSFIKHAQGKRGVMGFVLAPGFITKGQEVRLFPPM